MACVQTFKAFLKSRETGLIQNSAEWAKARQETIGASEISVLTGSSPFETKETLISKKICSADMSKNVACTWGFLFEPIIRRYFYRGAKILRSTKDFSYLFGVGKNGAGWVCPGGSLKRGKIVFFFAMFAASKMEKAPLCLGSQNKTPIYMRMERARYTATLASMGLRAEASLAKHLLLENCWENNLLPDISKVDYFKGPPRSNKSPAIEWSTPICRRHLHMRLFGPNGGRPRAWHTILRASVETNSTKNLCSSARSSGRPSKKHQGLEHSACNLQRFENSGNDCENRKRHWAAGKKAVGTALPREGGLRVFCSKGRRVGGRYRPPAGAPTNAGQTSGKPRRQHVRNRLYPGLLRNGRQRRAGIPFAGKRFRNAGVWRILGQGHYSRQHT